MSSSIGCRSTAYRSLWSNREIDLLPDDAIVDLRAIASRMAAVGYDHECAQVYASVRKPVVDTSLRRLGVEHLSIGDVQRLEWATTAAGRHVASSRKRKKADLRWARRCKSARARGRATSAPAMKISLARPSAHAALLEEEEGAGSLTAWPHRTERG